MMMFAVTFTASKSRFANGLALDDDSQIISKVEASFKGMVYTNFSRENIAVLTHALSSKLSLNKKELKDSLIYASKNIMIAQ